MARPRSSAAPATRRAAQVQSKDRATSSVAARRAVLKRIKDEGVEHVLFWFTDLEGHLKSFAITPNEMEGALDDGMGFDGSSITGFNRIEESDMVAIPDPATFELMPRPVDDHGHELGSKVGRMICDVVKPDGTPYEGDPRYILKLALERMKKMGFDTFNVGPELEYFLFEDDKGTETIDEGGYFAMTVAGCGDRGAQRHDRGARVGRASRSSTTTTRSPRRSTRSTCATTTRSRWPTRR